MSVLTRYLSVRVGLLCLIVLAILASLGLAFDLMEHADQVLDIRHDSAMAVVLYAILRLPDFVGQMLPIAALIGTLMMLGLLMRNNELVALWSSGVSIVSLMAAVFPVALFFTIIQGSLDDRVIPDTLARLHEWGLSDFRRGGLFSHESDAVWLISGDDVVRMPTSKAVSGKFDDIQIFRRDPNGVLTEQLNAETAEPSPNGWQLRGVTQFDAIHATVNFAPVMYWPGQINVNRIELISRELRELTITDMMELIRNQGFGQRPVSLTETWIQHRISSMLSPALMILLGIALTRSYERGRGFGPLFLRGLAIGFAFFVFDGTTLAMGETGFLPPWLAAWAPKLVLISLISWFTLRYET